MLQLGCPGAGSLSVSTKFAGTWPRSSQLESVLCVLQQPVHTAAPFHHLPVLSFIILAKILVPSHHPRKQTCPQNIMNMACRQRVYSCSVQASRDTVLRCQGPCCRDCWLTQCHIGMRSVGHAFSTPEEMNCRYLISCSGGSSSKALTRMINPNLPRSRLMLWWQFFKRVVTTLKLAR